MQQLTGSPFNNLKSSLESDLIVWSHLRWDFVFQRPQHLLTRFAKERRVFFFEEPHFTHNNVSSLKFAERENGVQVVTPQIPHGLSEAEVWVELRTLIDQMMEDEEIQSFTSWYYTPMALPFTDHLKPEVIIFDAMDELSAFKGAPVHLLQLESELLKVADVVFTGGQSIFEAKQHRHHNIHCFPSSIDTAHFAQARTTRTEPADQAKIAGPRVGFFGVLDERFDIELLQGAAALRPDWNFIIIGPVVKIDPATLPQASNIHYLGGKHYQELPQYLAGWDLATLLFARNVSTRFISPTKTPEYLAAGRPVVSTSIKDVIRPYAEEGLVQIADTPEAFVRAAEKAMLQKEADPTWIKRVDAFLSDKSWDHTCKSMRAIERKAKSNKMPEAGSALQKSRKVYGTQLKA